MLGRLTINFEVLSLRPADLDLGYEMLGANPVLR